MHNTLGKIRRIALSFCAFATAAARSAFAAITYDADATKTATNASSVTRSQTVGKGTNRILLVSLATEDTSNSVLTISASDFQSLTVPSAGFNRNSDGNIAYGIFAKLVSTRPLVNAGIPSGTDLGAIESY